MFPASSKICIILFLLTPLREGRREAGAVGAQLRFDFYSRPCGRGDTFGASKMSVSSISTHAPAGGATHSVAPLAVSATNFYSRPCGRGDEYHLKNCTALIAISTHAPAGGATPYIYGEQLLVDVFLLTPLREGRLGWVGSFVGAITISTHAPAGGATLVQYAVEIDSYISTHAPAGGATFGWYWWYFRLDVISTHAPAGGATAIFHKSVMRFCGKLPKDDTVLCLASFGFPRRDPKAVYLAWISCANLPQKCVRQGLALKDQGTSCFHVGLASHAFDPVLV